MKKNSSQSLIIKKYENRRLYNTLTSQYINQDQVAQLVRDGHDVRVVDAATGEDLTRLVLAQIVLDDAKTPDSVFPLDVLRQMIVASGRATQENALRYMKAMLDMYQNAYRALPPPMNPFEFMQTHWGRPPSDIGPSPSPNGSTGGSRSPHSRSQESSKTAAQAADVVELKKRIEELESMLPRRAAKKKARKTISRRKT